MTLFEYYDSKIPEYYPTMYKDGYTPAQISYAARRKIGLDFLSLLETDEEEEETPTVIITSEVKIK